MKTQEQIYNSFITALIEDKIYEDYRITYNDICYCLGVSPKKMDTKLMKELGMEGEQLLFRLRLMK